MEPITVSIVAALAAGAAAAAKDVASTAVKDAYAALKQLLITRYRKTEPFVEAVEADPMSEPEQKVLSKQLDSVTPDNDLKDAVARLLGALEELRNDPRAEAVFDFDKLRAAKNFELSDVEFGGTLLRARDATFEGDFKATHLRQGSSADPAKN